MTRKLIFAPPTLFLVVSSLLAQQAHTARDAFWSASDLISVAPNPAADKHARSHTTPHPSQGDGKVQLVSDNGYGAAPHLISAELDRLGLRCSVWLEDASGEYIETAPDTVFHSGDKIRLGLLANEPGYLYVVQKGSSGSWLPLYPGAKTVAGANQVQPGQLRVFPGEGPLKYFQFDQNAGDEELFVILSRTPIADIERSIHGLQSEQPDDHSESTAGAPMLEAENKIPDAFMQQMVSRDLILVDEEQVDHPSTAGSAGEKAVYAVSKGGSQAQVIVKLNLRHN